MLSREIWIKFVTPEWRYMNFLCAFSPCQSWGLVSPGTIELRLCLRSVLTKKLPCTTAHFATLSPVVQKTSAGSNYECGMIAGASYAEGHAFFTRYRTITHSWLFGSHFAAILRPTRWKLMIKFVIWFHHVTVAVTWGMIASGVVNGHEEGREQWRSTAVSTVNWFAGEFLRPNTTRSTAGLVTVTNPTDYWTIYLFRWIKV